MTYQIEQIENFDEFKALAEEELSGINLAYEDTSEEISGFKSDKWEEWNIKVQNYGTAARMQKLMEKAKKYKDSVKTRLYAAIGCAGCGLGFGYLVNWILNSPFHIELEQPSRSYMSAFYMAFTTILTLYLGSQASLAHKDAERAKYEIVEHLGEDGFKEKVDWLIETRKTTPSRFKDMKFE